MKIVVAGTAKSGTTILFFIIKYSNPFSGDCEYLFEPEISSLSRKNYDPKQAVLAKILIYKNINYNIFNGFDKKIVLTRDPRDFIVSLLLYHGAYHEIWNKEVSEIQAGINLLKRKTYIPSSVSMVELWKALCGFSPTETKNYLKERFEPFLQFYRENPGYFLFKYEELIDGKLDQLETHLGFKLKKEIKVDKEYTRVERTKGTGDWRAWFTPQDISFFKPLCLDYMETFGYDVADWQLSQKQEILPEHSFDYVKRLVNERRSWSDMAVLP